MASPLQGVAADTGCLWDRTDLIRCSLVPYDVSACDWLVTWCDGRLRGVYGWAWD